MHHQSYCYSTVLNLNVVLLHNNSSSSRNYGPFPFLTSFPRTGIGCRRYSSGGVSDSVNGACCNERQQRQSAILTVAVAARAAHGGVNGRSFLSWRAELRIHKSIIDRSERASEQRDRQSGAYFRLPALEVPIEIVACCIILRAAAPPLPSLYAFISAAAPGNSDSERKNRGIKEY